jgi:hypothetical protein
MRTRIRTSKIGITSARPPQTTESISYQAIIGGLVAEMRQLVSATRGRKFSPPFEMVIIGNHGEVAFRCGIARDGKVRRLGHSNKLRYSHFPANAFITDRFLVTRTFRIDRVSRKGTQR